MKLKTILRLGFYTILPTFSYSMEMDNQFNKSVMTIDNPSDHQQTENNFIIRETQDLWNCLEIAKNTGTPVSITLSIMNAKMDYGHPSYTRIKCFESILNNMDHIEALNLSHHDIDDEVVQFLAKKIAANKTLKRLILSHNNIGDRGVKFLSEALKSNSTLAELDISYNNIASTIILPLIISKNTSLTSLSLEGNKMSATAAQYFAYSLKDNSTLETLTLGSNSISHDDEKKLEIIFLDNLKNNKTFKTVYWTHFSSSNKNAL